MRIAFCADLHLANHKRYGTPTAGLVAPINTRARDILDVVRRARKRCEDEGVTDLFILGDVFDTTTPEPQLVAELQVALASLKDLNVHIMVGNHDQLTDQRGDHSLISMDGTRNIQVYDRPTVVYVHGSIGDGAVVYLVPYQPGHARKYLNGVIKELCSTVDDSPSRYGHKTILGLHLGLIADRTEGWLLNSHDAYPAEELVQHRFNLVVAGNWHGRYEVLPDIWQCGALVPTGFDNPGWEGYGSLLIYDGKRLNPVELDGPRFIKVADLAEARKALEIAEGKQGPVYLSAKASSAEEKEQLKDLFDAYGHTLYEIASDKGTTEAAASAVKALNNFASPEGIKAAITAYVGRMPLADGLDRSEVLSLALDYTAGGASQ